MLGILLLILIGAVWVLWMHPAKGKETDQKQHAGLGHRFTIIMQTKKRSAALLRLLRQYQAVPHLKQIIVVWNNVGEKMPMEIWNSRGPHLVPVAFKEQRCNRLANRFQPFPELHTDSKFLYFCIEFVCVFVCAHAFLGGL